MSWDSLAAIEEERRLERQPSEPVACPNDGEPLLADPRGGLRCPFDGWRWPEDG